jgi:hypothetical protein
MVRHDIDEGRQNLNSGGLSFFEPRVDNCKDTQTLSRKKTSLALKAARNTALCFRLTLVAIPLA